MTKNERNSVWQVAVEHPDTDAVLVVAASSEREALAAGATKGCVVIGEGAVAVQAWRMGR